jgi:hypothetical protein
MKLRFMNDPSSLVSRAIMLQEKTAMPLTPSHVEYLTPDGQFYIGAHLSGGVRKRPVGYDKTPTMQEIILDLGATPEQDQIFDVHMNSIVGEPYDWRAILGFILPEHEHILNHVICSAACVLGLRKCSWLQSPIATPAHLTSPRDLLMGLSFRTQVPGI